MVVINTLFEGLTASINGEIVEVSK